MQQIEIWISWKFQASENCLFHVDYGSWSGRTRTPSIYDICPALYTSEYRDERG